MNLFFAYHIDACGSCQTSLLPLDDIFADAALNLPIEMTAAPLSARTTADDRLQSSNDLCGDNDGSIPDQGDAPCAWRPFTLIQYCLAQP